MTRVRAPIPQAPEQYDKAAIDQIVHTIEQRLSGLERAISSGWAMSNVTETKTLDANSGTLADLAAAEAAIDATRDVLATLINKLKEGGVLSK